MWRASNILIILFFNNLFGLIHFILIDFFSLNHVLRKDLQQGCEVVHYIVTVLLVLFHHVGQIRLVHLQVFNLSISVGQSEFCLQGLLFCLLNFLSVTLLHLVQARIEIIDSLIFLRNLIHKLLLLGEDLLDLLFWFLAQF